MRLLHCGPGSLSLAISFSLIACGWCADRTVESSTAAAASTAGAQPAGEKASSGQSEPKPDPTDNATWPVARVELTAGSAMVTHHWPAPRSGQQTAPPKSISAVFVIANGDDQGLADLRGAQVLKKTARGDWVPSDDWGIAEAATSGGGTQVTVSSGVEQGDQVRLVYRASKAKWNVAEYRIVSAGEAFDAEGARVEQSPEHYFVQVIVKLANQSGGGWATGAEIVLLSQDGAALDPQPPAFVLPGTVQRGLSYEFPYVCQGVELDVSHTTTVDDFGSIDTQVTLGRNAETWPLKGYGDGALTASPWLTGRYGTFTGADTVPVKPGDALGTFSASSPPLKWHLETSRRFAIGISRSTASVLHVEKDMVELPATVPFDSVTFESGKQWSVLSSALSSDSVAPGQSLPVVRARLERQLFRVPEDPNLVDPGTLQNWLAGLETVPLPAMSRVSAGFDRLGTQLTRLQSLPAKIQEEESAATRYCNECRGELAFGFKKAETPVERDKRVAALRDRPREAIKQVSEVIANYNAAVAEIDALPDLDRAQALLALLWISGSVEQAPEGEAAPTDPQADGDGHSEKVPEEAPAPEQAAPKGDPRRFDPDYADDPAKRVHVLLVCDTEAVGIGPKVAENLAHMKKFFADAFQGRETMLGDARMPTVLKVADATQAGVAGWCRGLEAPEESTVVFYYSGHGGVVRDDRTDLVFRMSDGHDLNRSEVRKAIQAVKPHCAIILSDCCCGPIRVVAERDKLQIERRMRRLQDQWREAMNEQGLQSIVGRTTVRTGIRPPDRATVDWLLLKHQGTIDITGASPRFDQAAWMSAENGVGGYFTHSLLSILSRPPDQINQERNRVAAVVDWRQAFSAIQNETMALSLGTPGPPGPVRLWNALEMVKNDRKLQRQPRRLLHQILQVPYAYSFR